VALNGCPTARSQEAESLIESCGDLKRTHRRDPSRRKLDSQRDAVQTATDLGDGRIVVRTYLEFGPNRTCSVDEELDRFRRLLSVVGEFIGYRK
jgi:hypothetical protein